jgi:hypothetical protein
MTCKSAGLYLAIKMVWNGVPYQAILTGQYRFLYIAIIMG